MQGLLSNAAVIGIAGVCTLGAIATSVPREYLKEGHFGTVIWDRVVESLGLNPAFPFPGVQEMFNCKKYIPQGMQPGIGDDNGHCIFIDYINTHNIPIGAMKGELYGCVYETAMRKAFFKIVARYPAEALKTFVYYKPRYIVWSIALNLQFNFSGDQTMRYYSAGPKVTPYPLIDIWLLLASLATAFVYFSVAAIKVGEMLHIAGVILFAVLFTLPSYFAVWAMPPTSADLLLFCLMALGLMLGAVLLVTHETLRRIYAFAGCGKIPALGARLGSTGNRKRSCDIQGSGNDALRRIDVSDSHAVKFTRDSRLPSIEWAAVPR